MTNRDDAFDAQRLLAELRVHQEELEEQNAALREARDAAEAALANYTDLYEFAPVGYATVRTDGTIAAANLSLATLLGVERARLVGRSLLQWVTPSDRPAVTGFLERLRSGEPGPTIEVGMLAAADVGLVTALSGTAMAGGDSMRIAITDQTQRRHAEHAFQQSQKMEAVGRLAGGIAHDLNNLLTVVGMHNEFALAQRPAGDPAREDLLAVQGAVQRATALTSKLLAFARPQVLDRRRVAVGRVVEEFARLIRRVLPERIDIATHIAPGTGDVLGDPVQLEQVLMNLAMNANDAMPDGGRLVFATEAVTLTADDVAGHPGVGPGAFVILRATDTGVGMSAGTLARVFEPFYTTKPVGKGTGLGLATVYAIAHQAGGFVTVSSRPGAGSTFEVVLPRAASTATPVSAPVLGPPDGGTETVLIVEDEPSIRQLARRVLERLGYTCHVAVDGVDALQQMQAIGDRVDLVLSDVVMPRMSGPDFARRARTAHPRLPILFMTGYASANELETPDIPAHAGVLHKPFTVSDLGRMVREALDKT